MHKKYLFSLSMLKTAVLHRILTIHIGFFHVNKIWWFLRTLTFLHCCCWRFCNWAAIGHQNADVSLEAKPCNDHGCNVHYIFSSSYPVQKFPSHMNARISWTDIRTQEVKCLKFKNWLIACLLYDVNEGRSINKRDGRTWRGRLLVLQGLRTLHTHSRKRNESHLPKRGWY